MMVRSRGIVHVRDSNDLQVTREGEVNNITTVPPSALDLFFPLPSPVSYCASISDIPHNTTMPSNLDQLMLAFSSSSSSVPSRANLIGQQHYRFQAVPFPCTNTSSKNPEPYPHPNLPSVQKYQST